MPDYLIILFAWWGCGALVFYAYLRSPYLMHPLLEGVTILLCGIYAWAIWVTMKLSRR